MIYDVNSPLFRSFLSQKGGAADKRKNEEQKPKEHKPKANENKPVMNEKSKARYMNFRMNPNNDLSFNIVEMKKVLIRFYKNEICVTRQEAVIGLLNALPSDYQREKIALLGVWERNAELMDFADTVFILERMDEEREKVRELKRKILRHAALSINSISRIVKGYNYLYEIKARASNEVVERVHLSPQAVCDLVEHVIAFKYRVPNDLCGCSLELHEKRIPMKRELCEISTPGYVKYWKRVEHLKRHTRLSMISNDLCSWEIKLNRIIMETNFCESCTSGYLKDLKRVKHMKRQCRLHIV